MKKFFTNISIQNEGKLDNYIYEAKGNSLLNLNKKISFPIIAAINGYVNPNEDFIVVSVVTDIEDGSRNLSVLKEQVKELCAEKELKTPAFEDVIVPNDENVSVQLNTFQKLIDYVGDDDELFACITYGTKPMAQTLLMALQYAYRVKINASIECVVYGKVDRTGSKENWFGEVYDMTALIKMDEITNMLAKNHVANPEAAIRAILGL